MTESYTPLLPTIRQELEELDKLASQPPSTESMSKWRLREQQVRLSGRIAWMKFDSLRRLTLTLGVYWLTFFSVSAIPIIYQLARGRNGIDDSVEIVFDFVLGGWGAAALLSSFWPLVVFHHYSKKMDWQTKIWLQERELPSMSSYSQLERWRYGSIFVFTFTALIAGMFFTDWILDEAIVVGIISAALAGNVAFSTLDSSLYSRMQFHRLTLTGTLFEPGLLRPPRYVR